MGRFEWPIAAAMQRSEPTEPRATVAVAKGWRVRGGIPFLFFIHFLFLQFQGHDYKVLQKLPTCETCLRETLQKGALSQVCPFFPFIYLFF